MLGALEAPSDSAVSDARAAPLRVSFRPPTRRARPAHILLIHPSMDPTDQSPAQGRRQPSDRRLGCAQEGRWTPRAPRNPMQGPPVALFAEGGMPAPPPYAWGGDPLDAAAAVLPPRSPADLALRFSAEAARMNAVGLGRGWAGVRGRPFFPPWLSWRDTNPPFFLYLLLRLGRRVHEVLGRHCR